MTVPDTSERVCPTFYYEDLWWAYTDAMVANVATDGTWYLAVVSSQPVAITTDGAAGPVELPTEQAFDGTWHFALALPDPALPGITLRQGSYGAGLPRPEGVDSG